MHISPELPVKAAAVAGAALMAQVGDDIGGVLGEVAKFGGLGGVSITAVVILNRVWRQRSEVQSETIEDLKAEVERLRSRLSERESG